MILKQNNFLIKNSLVMYGSYHNLK